MNQSGGNVIICGVRSNINLMLMNSNFDSDIGVDNKFMLSESEIFASSSQDLDRARVVLNCQTGNNSDKSIACNLLESVDPCKMSTR